MTPPKALKLRAEVEIHSVSCPGVFFACKGPVHLSICFLGFHVKTKPFPPSFPLLFHDRCRPGTLTYSFELRLQVHIREDVPNVPYAGAPTGRAAGRHSLRGTAAGGRRPTACRPRHIRDLRPGAPLPLPAAARPLLRRGRCGSPDGTNQGVPRNHLAQGGHVHIEW